MARQFVSLWLTVLIYASTTIFPIKFKLIDQRKTKTFCNFLVGYSFSMYKRRRMARSWITQRWAIGKYSTSEVTVYRTTTNVVIIINNKKKGPNL